MQSESSPKSRPVAGTAGPDYEWRQSESESAAHHPALVQLATAAMTWANFSDGSLRCNLGPRHGRSAVSRGPPGVALPRSGVPPEQPGSDDSESGPGPGSRTRTWPMIIGLSDAEPEY